MSDERQYLAVIDRISDGQATILMSERGQTFVEVRIPSACLAEPIRTEGMVFSLTSPEPDVLTITPDADRTLNRRREAQERFETLSERPPDGEAE